MFFISVGCIHSMFVSNLLLVCKGWFVGYISLRLCQFELFLGYDCSSIIIQFELQQVW